MVNRTAAASALWLASSVATAADIVRIGDYASAEFSLANAATFAVPVHLSQRAAVDIKLYTTDGDLVRSLASNQPLDPGDHVLRWDGRDDAGTLVPSEAYQPVVHARLDNGEEQVVDPRAVSGGEVVDDLAVKVGRNGDIAYTLPVASRVLIRVGVAGGPMLHSLVAWEPRPAGRNVQRWHGFDQDRLIDLREDKGLRVVVTAYQLPAHAIVVRGGDTDMHAYQQSRGWPARSMDPDAIQLTRGERRLARHHFMPSGQRLDPRVTLVLDANLPVDAQGLPIVADSARVRVDIPEDDRVRLQSSLYEITFYVDSVYVAEEEKGYVPLSWLWRPSGLTPGRHVLTVNVVGFEGQVGVRSLAFVVPDTRAAAGAD